MLLALACQIILLGSGMSDSKPTDYPQMERVELPDPKIPLAEVMAAEPKVAAWQVAIDAWNESDKELTDSEVLAMLAGKTNRDDAAIALWQSQHRLGLDALRALLDRSGDKLWIWPMPKEGNPANFEFDDFIKLRKLVIAVLSQCKLEARSPARCVDAAIMGNKLCGKLCAYDTTMIHLLVSNAMRTRIDEAALIATRSCLQAKDTVRLDQLARCYPDGFAAGQQASLANALRGEFHFASQSLVWMRKNLIKSSPFQDVGQWYSKESLACNWAILRLQPNRCAAHYAARSEKWIRRVPIPLARQEAEPVQKKLSTWQMLDPSPRAGLMCFEELTGGSAGFHQTMRMSPKQTAHNTLCRTVIALARHQLENNGALPTTLGELVPDYLPSLPLDPIDAQPLRYDAASAKLWSIGIDCKDDGGTAEPATDDSLPGYLITSESPDMVIDLKAFFTVR